MPGPSQRVALGALFILLALALLAIAVAAARAEQWVITSPLRRSASGSLRSLRARCGKGEDQQVEAYSSRGEVRGHPGAVARVPAHESQALRDRLILTYAPLVKYVAGRLGSGLPAHVDEGDLVSYGLLGLISAIERFDPDRDIKFETYAIARIKGAIIDELRAMDWVPRSVRSRARDIERAIGELEAKLTRAPTDEEISAKLGITRRSSRTR